jgi:hypothetical protein
LQGPALPHHRVSIHSNHRLCNNSNTRTWNNPWPKCLSEEDQEGKTH